MSAASCESRAGTTLTVSIVTYAPDRPQLTQTVAHLCKALHHAQQAGALCRTQVVLVDNGPGVLWRPRLHDLLMAADLPAQVSLISGHGNVGYGRGHNLALYHDLYAPTDYHLVLNPDVWMAEDALTEGLTFLAAHPEAGLLSPWAVDGQGQRQYLCKRLPTWGLLALRGFAPQWLRHRYAQALCHYEMREETQGDRPFWHPPWVSGCFMLCRHAALVAVGGFSPDYFLHFEDCDLSLRLAQQTQLVFVPTVRIQHFGGHTARKGWRQIAQFVWAGMRFFRQHPTR